MGQALIPDQVKHFPFFVGQRPDPLVELAPRRQSARIVAAVCWVGSVPACTFSRLVVPVRLMLGAQSKRAVIMPSQIDQLTAHLNRGQAEKFAKRTGCNLFQSPAEPQ